MSAAATRLARAMSFWAGSTENADFYLTTHGHLPSFVFLAYPSLTDAQADRQGVPGWAILTQRLPSQGYEKVLCAAPDAAATRREVALVLRVAGAPGQRPLVGDDPRAIVAVTVAGSPVEVKAWEGETSLAGVALRLLSRGLVNSGERILVIFRDGSSEPMLAP